MKKKMMSLNTPIDTNRLTEFSFKFSHADLAKYYSSLFERLASQLWFYDITQVVTDHLEHKCRGIPQFQEHVEEPRK